MTNHSAPKHSNQYIAQNGTANAPEPKKKPKKNLGLRIGIIAACVLVVVGIGLVVGVSWIDKALQGGKSDEEMTALKESLKANQNLNEPFYTLLIGTDARAGEPDYGARSDVMILVRVDPVDYKVTMVSVQRDTAVLQADGTYCKFNAIFASGGAAACVDAVSRLCGVDIAYYAEVNFQGVVDLINALDGVDVYIAETIDDYRVWDEPIEAGWQHLDGHHALAVARARHYADGDYTRSSYQRVIIQSLINKIMAANVTQYPAIVAAGLNCVSTSFTAADIYSLVLKFKDAVSGENAKEITFYSCDLPTYGQMIDGLSYVVMVDSLKETMMAEVDAGRDPSKIDLQGYGVTIESSVVGTAAKYDENGNRIE